NIPVSIRGYTSRRSGHQSLKDRGSFLDADIPEMGVTFASRNTVSPTLGRPKTPGWLRVILNDQWVSLRRLPGGAVRVKTVIETEVSKRSRSAFR
ncbi:hypothetical protein ACO2Q0_17695, partial [Phenylobacterium sp. VNQ135]|uniref:hypothetical protein n=1 Tax=Phenylobacterium sp. VNQ135 TaxID=3400922 RepID=UPI003BFDAF9A